MGPMALPALRFRYGQFLMFLKRRAHALEVFRSVARAAPAWSCIGFLLAERGELQPAIEAFERAALNG